MPRFMIGFSDYTTSTSPQTAMKAIGASARRFEVNEIAMFGSGVTAAADTMHECQVGFLTNATAGTAGASPTPEPLAQGGTVSGLTAGTAYSAEPTAYNTNVFQLFSFNQRGGMRWWVPAGDGFRTDGAQTALSLGVRVDSSAAGKVSGEMMWAE